jgi:cobalt transporter subunit CbtA
MFRRVFLAAVLAGAVAGLGMAFLQETRVTPFIFAAEEFENAAAGQDHAAHGGHGTATVTSQPDASTEVPAAVASEEAAELESWMPADGLERTIYTVLADLVVGIGFALALVGVSVLSGIPITLANGAVWGLCAFLAVSIAPAAGLPPELPGMPAADLLTRQAWWWFTVSCTGVGIGLLARSRHYGLWALAVALIALPHLIGAPQAPHEPSAVPAHLATGFAANALAAAAAFWALLGISLGLVNDRISGSKAT